jgi:putative endonuclease
VGRGHSSLALGRTGETAAADFLSRQGYRILERNYKTGFGEIDIVASEGETICFIEVKTRSRGGPGVPAESVHRRKQYRISKAAVFFLKEKKLLHRSARFDVVSVVSDGACQCSLIKNAFALSAPYAY